MIRLLRRIHSIWFYILFLGFYILMFPFYWLFLQIKKQWAYDVVHRFNTVWGYVILFPAAMPVVTVGRKKIDRKKTYVFAANHSSYLDIPITNVAIRNSFRFIGKAELNSIPLFGYMFSRLHISVNRASKIDAFRSFKKAEERLKEGRSVLLFPEGTIPDKKSVMLARFKEGAFRLAIANGLPIVPVTIIGADEAFPDDGSLLVYPRVIRVIFDDPIETEGMSVDDSENLKRKVYRIMYENIIREKDGSDEIADNGTGTARIADALR